MNSVFSFIGCPSKCSVLLRQHATKKKRQKYSLALEVKAEKKEKNVTPGKLSLAWQFNFQRMRYDISGREKE